MSGYKLFLKNMGGLTSVCRNEDFPEDFRVTYERDKINYPRVDGTRLFIFDSPEHAQAFQRHIGIFSSEVWHCDATDMRECPGIPSIWSIKEYWDKIKQGLRVRSYDKYDNRIHFNDDSIIRIQSHSPAGSYTCTSVRLLSKVS